MLVGVIPGCGHDDPVPNFGTIPMYSGGVAGLPAVVEKKSCQRCFILFRLESGAGRRKVLTPDRAVLLNPQLVK